MAITKKRTYNFEKLDVTARATTAINPGQTTPSVTILNLRNVIGAGNKEEPEAESLEYGQIAINVSSNKEKIFFRNDTNKLAVFEPSKKVLDEALSGDAKLQGQIDIINGDENTEGSFAHADKVLEDKLTPIINSKVQSVTGIRGVKATSDIGQNVTVEGVIHINDKILSIDNSGFTSTLSLSYDWDNGIMSLIGKDPNNPISQFRIQVGEKLLSVESYIGTGSESPIPLTNGNIYLKFSFGNEDGVHDIVYGDLTPLIPVYQGLNNNGIQVTVNKEDNLNYTVEASLHIAPDNTEEGIKNITRLTENGLFTGNKFDAGNYSADARDNEYKFQVLRNNNQDIAPLPSSLLDGEIAINTFHGKEKIYFKNSSGNTLAVFDTTQNILSVVDEKILTEISKLTDPNITSSLQYQINYEIARAEAVEKEINDELDIINGDDNTEGSFRHVIKIVQEQLAAEIDSITASTATNIIGQSNQNIIVNVHNQETQKIIEVILSISRNTGNAITSLSDGIFVQDLSPRLTTVENNLTQLEEEVSNINTGYEAEISEIRGDISNVNNEITSIKNNVSGLTTNVTNIQGDINDIKENITNLETKVSGNTNDITDLKNDISEINDKINIINGDENTNGSFQHADQQLKEELTQAINDATAGMTVNLKGGNTQSIQTTVTNNASGTTIQSSLIVSPTQGNALKSNSNGVFVEDLNPTISQKETELKQYTDDKVTTLQNTITQILTRLGNVESELEGVNAMADILLQDSL